MTTVLYRKNGGEVLKISLRNQGFSDANTTYFGVLTSPGFPDGMDIQENLGDGSLGLRRQLGFAKFADVGGDSVRNATQPEIDAWAGNETTDRNLLDKERARVQIEDSPIDRKVFRALGKLLVQEFNILRSLHGLPDRTIIQLSNALSNALSEDD